MCENKMYIIHIALEKKPVPKEKALKMPHPELMNLTVV
jgi:hypothetical protein